MTLFGIAMHRAVAPAAGFGVTIAVPDRIGVFFVGIDPARRPPLTIGAVNLLAFAVVVAMKVVATPLGVKLAHAINPRPLRLIFAAFPTLVALNMLQKALI